MPASGSEPEKRLYPSQQRRLIARTLAAGDALPKYLVHVGVRTGEGDPVEAALAHYRGADGRYLMHAFAADLLSWKPVVAAFDRITRNS